MTAKSRVARERPACRPAKRTGEPADVVGNDGVPQGAIPVEILVGVDQNLADLGSEAREHVRGHRPPVEFDQPLVDAAHPAALAAGQHDAGDVGSRDQLALRKRSPPVKSRKWRLVARPIMVIPTFSAISKPIWVSPERETRKGMPICAALITISEVRRPVV